MFLSTAVLYFSYLNKSNICKGQHNPELPTDGLVAGIFAKPHLLLGIYILCKRFEGRHRAMTPLRAPALEQRKKAWTILFSTCQLHDLASLNHK